MYNQPHTNQPQVGFGALSLKEESSGHLYQAAYAAHAETAGEIPPARPARDERGRKMSQSYRPHSERVRLLIPAFLILTFSAILTAIAIITPNKPKNAGEYAAMIGMITVPLAISITLLLVAKATSRAIAWDNRHGALLRKIAAQLPQSGA
ncbi:MAG: hypothetical protein Q4C71_06025, partial [Microbacteriaceae bacterium]|nr:hypothetical protein [Microbacteriaceae bacterium]